ncbi:MAG TPA: hypothetical protein VGB00_07105 [Pyrinomonadaceae bacterium]
MKLEIISREPESPRFETPLDCARKKSRKRLASFTPIAGFFPRWRAI